MNTEKNQATYTAEDIIRYLSGNMSHKEMYALEKAALNDPFLSEAIEGYESMPQKEWSADLSALKKKLDAVENAPIVPLYKSPVTKWWKAAAAVLIIASSIAIAYLFTNKRTADTEAIAYTKTTADSMAAAKMDTATSVNDGNALTGIMSQKNSSEPAKSLDDTVKQILLADANPIAKKQNEFSRNSPPVTNAITTNEDNDKQLAPAGAASVRLDSAGYNQSYAIKKVNANKELLSQDKSATEDAGSEKTAPDYFNAQVVTADNKPVAYARVSVPQKTNPVYTDEKGNFTLNTNDAVVNVTVASPGFETKKIDLQNNAGQNKIILQPNDIAGKEISVGRKKQVKQPSIKKEAAGQLDGDDDEAEPCGGWTFYNDYLQNSLILPYEAKEKNIHGEVRLLLELKKNGDVSKIKIDKPLCDACDAEAVRLVKEGPKWKVKKNKAAKVKVKF